MKPILAEMQNITSMVPTIFELQIALGLWLRNHVLAAIASMHVWKVVQRFFVGGSATTDGYKQPEHQWVA